MAKIRSYTLPADTSPDLDDVLWVDKSGGTTRSITLSTLGQTLEVVSTSGSVPAALSQMQTFTKGITIGTPATDDSALLIKRAAINPLSSGGSHALRDESTYAASGTGGYASYDAIPVINSASLMDHIRGFQARVDFSGSAGLSQLASFHSQPTIAGNMTNAYGLYVDNALGVGTIALQFGVFVNTLTRGTGNYGIYVNGNDSYFGGKVQVTGAVEATGLVSGSNVYARNAENTVALGVGVPAGGASYYGTFIGHNAGHSVTATNGQTYVGSRAGYTNTTAGGVYIGNGAGYYETAANKLFIDNATRTSEGGGRTDALIYGVFDAVVANQSLALNVGSLGLYGVTPVARATTAVDAATFAESSGTAVNEASTFDGYTLKQVVKALRNVGILT